MYQEYLCTAHHEHDDAPVVNVDGGQFELENPAEYLLAELRLGGWLRSIRLSTVEVGLSHDRDMQFMG
jgi:hypothetical protein